MSMPSDSELLDFADQFCDKRGGKDRFATLGLSLDIGSEIDIPPVSFREALRRLLAKSKDNQSNQDACFTRSIELIWAGDGNHTCADVKEQLVQEFGTETVESTLAALKKL